MSYNVFVTRSIPEIGLELLRKHCERVDVFASDRVMKHAELANAIRGRDGVLSLLTDVIDAPIIQAADKLKIISNYAVGYNNIDIAIASEKGIMVTNTPGVLTEATADLAWALLFSLARRIVESDQFMRAGKFTGWAPKLFLGGSITGKTLGIIGAGRIGTAMAERAKGFKMPIIYSGSNPKPDFENRTGGRFVPFKELFETADFISLHVPLNATTRYLIDTPELKAMKKTAYLINTSRGLVINETALHDALANKRIAGAGLDVFENEPQVLPGLLSLANVVLSPHTGSATRETRDRMALMAAENLIAGLNGRQPANIVNPQVSDMDNDK